MIISRAPTAASTALVALPRRPVALGRPRTPTAAGGVGRQWSNLERLFWVGVGGLLVLLACKIPGQSVECLAGATLIVAAAMLPSYLWVRRVVRGLPLFPAFALTFIWSFGLPLVSEQRIIILFPHWNQFVGGLSVTGFLLLGTLVWYFVGRRPVPAPRECLMMKESDAAPWLLLALCICAIWTVVYAADWIRLPPGLDSLSRGIQLPIEVLACFVLSYQLGLGKLPGLARATFLTLLVVLMIGSLPSLLLFLPMSLAGVSMIAYVAGSKRLPWRAGLVALMIFGFLHVGKSEMREKHWRSEEKDAVTPLQFPGFLLEWVGTSWELMRHGEESEKGENLLDRASLMHWLLYFEASSPDAVPFLHGESYTILPSLLVPRIFNPDKPLATEGITIVGVHYGIITREDADVVTIGFGLMNEAFANFGYYGMAGLAVLLGALYGQVARWARGTPVLSLRGLFAISMADYAIQGEFSASFYVTALLQSTSVLLILALLFMRRRTVDRTNASLID